VLTRHWEDGSGTPLKIGYIENNVSWGREDQPVHHSGRSRPGRSGQNANGGIDGHPVQVITQTRTRQSRIALTESIN